MTLKDVGLYFVATVVIPATFLTVVTLAGIVLDTVLRTVGL